MTEQSEGSTHGGLLRVISQSDGPQKNMRKSACTCDSLFDHTRKASLYRLVPKKGRCVDLGDLGEEGGPFATLDINPPPPY